MSGVTFPIADGYETFGEPCDGVATWEAMWTGADLEVYVNDCLDSMEALPAGVRDLLTAGDVDIAGVSAAVADLASPVAAALDASSWERTDGRGVVLWTGSCHEFHRFSLQSQVSLADGFLQMHSQRCGE
jgi:hypothetical protein